MDPETETISCPICLEDIPKNLFGSHRKKRPSSSTPSRKGSRGDLCSTSTKDELDAALSDVQTKHLREKAVRLVLRGRAQDEKWVGPLANFLGGRTAPSLDSLLRVSVRGIVIPSGFARKVFRVFFHRSKKERGKLREKRANELAKRPRTR